MHIDTQEQRASAHIHMLHFPSSCDLLTKRIKINLLIVFSERSLVFIWNYTVRALTQAAINHSITPLIFL